MPLPNSQIAFSGGSSSLDPNAYRVIDNSVEKSLRQLVSAFPELGYYFNSQSLLINAYPSALGLNGVAPFVDTYLHPPAFIRASRLAAQEKRKIVMVAQPLVGADFLLRLANDTATLTTEILWAVGGYFLPESLESFIRRRLEQRGCHLKCLYSYGAAEIGHSCFAAVDRFASGNPRFRLVASEVQPEIDPANQRLTLSLNQREVDTGDTAEIDNGFWIIQSNRLSPKIHQMLESWSDAEWEKRTGYLELAEDRFFFQLREQQYERRETDPAAWHDGFSAEAIEYELPFHQFWHQFEGSFCCKPKWLVPDNYATERLAASTRR